MTFTITEIAAYLGAAAWVVPIVQKLIDFSRRAILTLHPHEEIRFTFSNVGPSISIDLALVCQNKDILIDKMELVIAYEDKSEHYFRWVLQEEQQGAIDIPEHGSMLIRRTKKAIAIFLERDSLQERTIQFHDDKFIAEYRKALDPLNDLANQIFANGQPADIIAQSREMARMKRLYHNFNYWKAGTYTLNLHVYFGKRLVKWDSTIRLSEADVDRLKQNSGLIESWLTYAFVLRNAFVPISFAEISAETIT